MTDVAIFSWPASLSSLVTVLGIGVLAYSAHNAGAHVDRRDDQFRSSIWGVSSGFIILLLAVALVKFID